MAPPQKGRTADRGRGTDVAPALYSRHEQPAPAYELYSRGSAMLHDGHPHAAALILGRAKLLEPDKASIREALGRALFMSGRATRARRVALRTGPRPTVRRRPIMTGAG